MRIPLIIATFAIILLLCGIALFDTPQGQQQQQQTASTAMDSTSQVKNQITSATSANPPQSSSSTAAMIFASNSLNVCQSLPSNFSTLNATAGGSGSSIVSYALVGGQSGRWFQQLQYPRLFALQLSPRGSLSNLSDAIPLRGTVWGGGWNGSEWTISGWGTCNTPVSSNPYILHLTANGSSYFGSLEQGQDEWTGGDIFSASANGSRWMLTGMGSGYTLIHSSRYPRLLLRSKTNHLSLGLTAANGFVDYSTSLPRKMDGVLFASCFNGTEWLVGGGWESTGVLFAFNGKNFTDLTPSILRAIPTFHSVQTIAWNGKYWLVGGVGFLAKYSGSTFSDLTAGLNYTLSPRERLSNLTAVNSVSWNGSVWLLGGGYQIASPEASGLAWLASLDSRSVFSDLTSYLPQRALPVKATTTGTNLGSTVLSITFADGSWIIGGAAANRGMLFAYRGSGATIDYSGLLGDMTYVDWVGAS